MRKFVFLGAVLILVAAGVLGYATWQKGNKPSSQQAYWYVTPGVPMPINFSNQTSQEAWLTVSGVTFRVPPYSVKTFSVMSGVHTAQTTVCGQETTNLKFVVNSPVAVVFDTVCDDVPVVPEPNAPVAPAAQPNAPAPAGPSVSIPAPGGTIATSAAGIIVAIVLVIIVIAFLFGRRK